MARAELPLAFGFYISESTPLLNKRIVNMRVVVPESSAVTTRALLNTPGLTQVTSVDESISRGVIEFNDGVIYRVIGNSLYSIDLNNVAVSRGYITGTRDVSMATNGINIAIQDPDGGSYFYTPSTATLEDNAGAAFLSFGQAETVAQKDGFYVYTTKTNFFSSSSKVDNDGKNFNALDFADAEILPDFITKCHVNHNQLYIGGKDSIEVFQTIATSGFPFQRITNAYVQKGISAPNTAVDFDDGFMFIGGGRGEKASVWKVRGSTFSKLSDSSIDHLLQKESQENIKNARAWVYSDNGAYHAVFTVGNNTFVYDATASRQTGVPQWHQRQTGISVELAYRGWRARHGIVTQGNVQVADDRSGIIGILDATEYTEYGADIERVISTKPFISNLESVFNYEIELFMETGVGNPTEPDPVIRLDYSDDGGATYSHEIPKSIGKIGERRVKVIWDRLGEYPIARELRWKTVAPVKISIYALFADFDVGI